MKIKNTLAFNNSELAIVFCNQEVADEFLSWLKVYKLVFMFRNITKELDCFSADHVPTENALIVTNAKGETLFIVDYVE